MKKIQFETTDYLIVEVTDRINEKYVGFKCIPAHWAENALRFNYLLIRYPEEETFETILQVKNKEAVNPTWPLYCALLKFVTDSYEKACKLLDFLTEKDKMNLPTPADEPATTKLEIAELSTTPSTSFKRRSSDEIEKITNNDDIIPKKKRESAIRSENNLKILIQTGQLLSNKQKVPPKKLVSLRKEFCTETLESWINAEKFDKIDKLYNKVVSTKSYETLEISDSTDDNDTESDIDGQPEKSILAAILTNKPNPAAAVQMDVTPEKSQTPVRETVITNTSQIPSTNHLDQHNEPKTNTDRDQSSFNAEISTLGGHIRNLAITDSEIETVNSMEDIQNLEDICYSILVEKRNFSADCIKNSERLRKAFKSINLFVPELKQGLSLPSLQQLRENRQQAREEPQPSTSRQENETQRQEQPSHSRASTSSSH